jgi:hypothetical protein
MLDVAVAYNRFKFLGHEYLTWLWYTIENDFKLLRQFDADITSLEIGNRIVFENRRQNSVETITIKGDDAGLEEGLLALKKGGVVTELHLVYRSGDQEWTYTVKGESLNISTLKTPATGAVENKDDIEGAVIEKIFLCDKVLQLLDRSFAHFCHLRATEKWANNVAPSMANWIKSNS